MNPSVIGEWAELYRKTLLEDIVPFWMEHALDPSGAINNCLDDAGNLLSRDRYLWSQGRALWTFSALYNRIEQRKEWLDVARGIASYLYQNGRDAQGRWLYRLDADGEVIDWDTSIYVDGFVMNGLGEYYKATGDENAAKLAAQTYEITNSRLKSPGSYGIAPYLLAPGVKTLGIPMIFSFFYHNLGKAIGRSDITEAGHQYAKEILKDFYIPEHDAVMEFVNIDGGLADIPERRVTVPGHVIEAMWFLISISEQTREHSVISTACRMIKHYLELGWDDEFGGIHLALDIEGQEPVAWNKPDYKPWWVQCEALVATAYAYKNTREQWALDWHQKVQDYAYSHYPVPTGEWTQWLDRTGSKGESAALPVKDPFHLPRALIYLMKLFEQSDRNVRP